MQLLPTIQPFSLRLFFSVGFLFFAMGSRAQKLLPSQAIQVTAGYSNHGSGDYKGVVFGADYIKYLGKKTLLDFNFKGTIHDGKDMILVTNNSTGKQTDASVRFTNAGVQLGVNAGYSPLSTRHHQFTISLGGFGRYQSASNGEDGYSVYYPAATGQPAVLIGYDNRTPQRVFSLGYLLQLQYNYTISNKVYIGLAPAFQNDTNADMITHIALTVGRRF